LPPRKSSSLPSKNRWPRTLQNRKRSSGTSSTRCPPRRAEMRPPNPEPRHCPCLARRPIPDRHCPCLRIVDSGIQRSLRHIVTRRLRAMGRECVDHIVVLREAQPASNSAGLCTLLQRNQNAPVIEQRCAGLSPAAQRTGNIESHPILGGLHHHYVRI
jgi:hypothetical protein